MSSIATKPKVGLSKSFLDALADLPKTQQKKVRQFIDKFEADPTSPGINFEKIHNASNDNLRSVRIDQEYRAIMLHPQEGALYLLLWVDTHDEAYDWATRKDVAIHPETGGLQVYSAEAVAKDATEEIEKEREDEEGLFDEIRDRHLVKLGIPEILLPLVRSISSEEQLDQLQHHLPEEASEVLFMLAAGYSVEEADRELARKPETEDVDEEDYASALDQPDSKRRFYLTDGDQELDEILNQPLEQWRVFLHPSQRDLVTMNANGPVRVLGGAGTGKTVVAMHRAKHLAENITEKNQRILFTTYTKNLAADVKENLKKICSDQSLKRIEVVNIDAWVWRFLDDFDYDYEIKFPDQLQGIWEDALTLAPDDVSFSDQFYRDEWDHVIQPYDVMNKKDYVRVSRIGRSISLDRKQREKIWPIFDEYRRLLNNNGWKEFGDAARDARMILKDKGDILPYTSVVVDEGQDMSPQAFKLMRQMIPGGNQKNDIFIVGDAHQRIYRRRVNLTQCGIDTSGREYKLHINYRTTEENRRWAVSLLDNIPIDDLDGGRDEQDGYKSLMQGVEPQVYKADSFQEEVNEIVEFLQPHRDDESLKSVCLVARTSQLLEDYKSALKQYDIHVYEIRRSKPEDRSIPGLRLATMHRVKGLEFDNVLVAGVNDGIVPWPSELREAREEEVRQEIETQERCLLYVAVTRAKMEVLVTCHGDPSLFLEELT